MDYNGSIHSFRYSDLLAQLDRAQQRNLALFGQDLFRRGPRVDLLDQPLGRFQIIDAPTELELDQAALLQEVDLDGPFVPAEITGRLGLRPARGAAAERTVVIAANGVIRAVARVHEVGGDMRFSGILPESSLRNGANEVGVYAAEAGGILLHLGGTDRARGRFVRDGDRALVDAEGRRYAIVEPQDLRGRVQKIQSAGDRITFEGWAADFGTGEPADRVIAFDGGEQIYSGRTNAVRENVARRLERLEDRLFGYRFVLPQSAVEQLATLPALFALSEHAGIAVPLAYEESARTALTALLHPESRS